MYWAVNLLPLADAAVLAFLAPVFVAALAPLVLAGLLTLATCVALNLKLNFANIIALPLLLGIGVAFNIYFVVAWRAGAKDFLQSALTRAVIFSALTTATGFGTCGLETSTPSPFTTASAHTNFLSFPAIANAVNFPPRTNKPPAT